MLDLPLGDRGLKLMPLVALLFEEEAVNVLAEGILPEDPVAFAAAVC